MGLVTLTFDNGPDPRVTPHVLEVLARHRAPALFFVLGKCLDAPGGLALARRVHAEGHQLGNHSYSHEIPLGDDSRSDHVEQEIVRTERLLDGVCEGRRWFRPFGGGGKLGPHLFSKASVEYLQAHGYTCALWNSVPGDWLDADAWVDKALADADAQAHTVVVLHDVLPEAMEHLDPFLTELERRGHTFTQGLPDACLPLTDGRPRPGLLDYVR